MSNIGDMRQAIADVVETATSIPALPYAPGRLIVPSAVVMPGSPYLESGLTFGTMTAHFQVELIMGTAANQVVTSGLDDQIENALGGLLEAGYAIEQVSPPYALEANGQQYLAATISLNNSLRP
jgi:hypothetical protein